jgi:gliding motility-associated-like protein
MRFNTFITLFLLFVLAVPHESFAQNLVSNAGFETIASPVTGQGQLTALASPWQSLNATPDLYYKGQANLPITSCDAIDVPTNVGGYAPERTGKNGYAGISLDLNNNYREYISAPLSIPLLAGDLYRLEFYIQKPNFSRYACNRIGALLTNNLPIQPGTGVVNFIPQVEMVAQMTDTLNWILVTGVYQATGGENYITVGLFRSDSDPLLQKTDYGTQSTGCNSFDDRAYYYIDDVGVFPVTEHLSIAGDTILCPGETSVLTATSNVPFWWSDSNNPNDTLSLADSIVVSPNTQTTYYLNGIFQKDSITVLIVSAPYVNLGPDSLLCVGDTVELDAFATDGLFYYWSTGDTTTSIAVTDTGTYYVAVANSGCFTTDTIRFSGYLPNPPVSLGEDSMYCFFSYDTLHLDAGPGKSYLWSPTNETTQQITVLSPATYSVTVTHDNGCPRTAYLEVSEVCTPLVFAPSGFTPDGDGLNDLFTPYVNSATTYNLRIQNRRGQTIFYTEDPTKGWDGTFQGQDSPIGVYVYRLNYQGLDQDGFKMKRKILGTITLLR